MKTKLFSFLLAVIASTSMLFAQSGTCDDNLTWDLTDGVLTISGTGAMTSAGSNVPWYSFITSIQTIILSDGITSIGDYAFYGVEGLFNSPNVFYSSLTSVTIPNSVTSIGNRAFEHCTRLKKVYNYSSLLIVKGSTSNGYVGYYADEVHNYHTWSGTCGDNLTWELTDGVLTISGSGAMSDYSKNTSTPWYTYRSTIQTVLLPNSITTIGRCAFSGCSGLTSITIPNSVSSIGDYAFNNCSSLISVYLHTGSTIIDNSLFGTADIFVGTDVEKITIWNDLQNNITYLNPNTQVNIVSAHAPTNKEALYDMDDDGTMEFVCGSYVDRKFISGIGDCSIQDVKLFDNKGRETQTLISNDTVSPCGYLYDSRSNGYGIYSFGSIDNNNNIDIFRRHKDYNGNGEKERIKVYTEKDGEYIPVLSLSEGFPLDANLNGRMDFYSYQNYNSYGYNGNHYIYYRQADGSYLQTEIQIILDSAEANSSLQEVWSMGANYGGPMVTELENSLSNYMFLPNPTKNPYASIDTAIDIDQNGLVDLLSSTTGAALLNVGNNKFVQCQFPGKIILKDLNNDGISDYILYDSSTKTVSIQIFEDNGVLTTKTLMQNMAISDVWCYDFDNDGDVDILLPFNYTQSAGYAYLVFFRNDGNNTFKKIENAFDEPVWHFKFVDCKDVDNDGKYEILAVDSLGGDGNNYYYKGNHYIIRYNNRYQVSVDNEAFIQSSILSGRIGYTFHAPTIGDFDNNGILDYWYPVYEKSNLQYFILSHFSSAIPNTAPAKMGIPTLEMDTLRKRILIKWNRGSDSESSSLDLEYSLRIGSSSGERDMWFASAGTDGKQRDILGGNVRNSFSQWVNVADWPIGDYYISVQAIDPNGLGGAWSDELIYNHTLIGAEFSISASEITTVDTLLVHFSGAVDSRFTYNWDFGDSATIIAQDITTHRYSLVYNTSGEKTISLQVSDGQGNSSPIETKTIVVSPIKFVSTTNVNQSCIDINMDGLMDAIRHDGFYRGKTDGTMAKVAKTYNTDLTADGYSGMYYIDYNMDGLPDIIDYTNKGNVLINEDNFDFDFQSHDFVIQAEDLDAYDHDIITDDYPANQSHYLQWHDFNNDGWMDINLRRGYLSPSQQYADIHYGTADRNTYIGGCKARYIRTSDNSSVYYYIGTAAYWSNWIARYGDFNNDGFEDILTYMDNRFKLFLNYGEDNFRLSSFRLPDDVAQRIDGVADIDNDGYLDILIVKNDATILVLLGDANQSFSNRVELCIPNDYQLPTNTNFPIEDCSHDLDNNGYLDIVTSNGGVIYVHPEYQITMNVIPTTYIYPFVDLTGDGIPDLNGCTLQSRITNQAPNVPQNIRVIEENGAVKFMWDAAIDKETPATQMQYNISIKKKGASVGQEDAFIISPMNGLYDEAAIIPEYPYHRGTQMIVPYRRFETGEEYELQIQSIDGWNAHSSMSAPLTFTVQKNTVPTPTSFDVANTKECPTKILRNGQIFILRGEKVYTITGQEVK